MLLSALVSFVALEIIGIFVRKNIAISKKVDAERYDYTLRMLKETQKPDFVDDEEYNLSSRDNNKNVYPT